MAFRGRRRYCDYWMRYRDSRVSFIDLVRALIDAMHGHYQVATSETKFRVDHSDRIREVSVPAITPILGSIEIYILLSLCAVPPGI